MLFLSQKNNSKCITDLIAKCKTIKVLEDNGCNLHNLSFGDEFLHVMPKALS